MIKYNETVKQYRYKNTENYWTLIQYFRNERYLYIKTYSYSFHNIHLMSRRSLWIQIFLTAFLNVLGLSMHVLMSCGRLLKILTPE
jgi:hypothetical protein